MFKEISPLEFAKEYNVFNINNDWGVALASDNIEKNCLTVAWASFGYLWRKPTLTLYVNKKRYSEHIFSNAKYFSLCIFDKEKYKDELLYFGSKSGRDEDKFKNCKLTESFDLAPYFKEAKYVIICSKIGQTKFDINNVYLPDIVERYKRDGVHTIYEGEIIKILKNNEDL